MQCENFETRLNLLLDRRQRPEADNRLLAHAQGCEACRDLLAAQEFLFDGTDLLECPPVSEGFAQRVVAGLASPPQPANRLGGGGGRWLAYSAAAAALLLVAAIGVPWLVSSGKFDFARQQPVAPLVPSPGSLAVTEPSPVRPSELAPPDYRQMLGQFPEDPREALENVDIPGGLRPIATSFGVAVGLIRNTLPRVKDETPERKPQAAFPRGEWAERIG